MPTVSFNGVPAREAIANIQQKQSKLVPTKHWDDMRGAAHARAFTVAGATKLSLLEDLHSSVADAIANGQSISEFRKSFDQVVAKHGWQYKGQRGWRTRVIYDTNMRSAAAAGKWQKIEATKKALPFLVYMTVGDADVRDQHAKWHKMALPVDDDWWAIYYPPNDYGCRCYVIQASEAMLASMGITPLKRAPKVTRSERINQSTGESYGEVPDGVGVGFDFNVGKAWLGPDMALGRSLAQSVPAVRRAILPGLKFDALDKNFSQWAATRLADKQAGFMETVGFLDNDVVDVLSQKGVQLHSTAVAISSERLGRMQRPLKQTGTKLVPTEVLQSLPAKFRNAQAVLYEPAANKLHFILPGKAAEAGKQVKITVFLDYENKQQHLINQVRSGGSVNAKDFFDATRYELIKGKID